MFSLQSISDECYQHRAIIGTLCSCDAVWWVISPIGANFPE